MLSLWRWCIFTMASRYGLARPAMSLSSLCKTQGVKSPFIRETHFSVHWRSRGYARRVELFRIICILWMFSFFYYSSHSCARMSMHLSVGYKRNQLFTSEKNPTYSLFCWPLVFFYPDKSLVRTFPMVLSLISYHLSLSLFNANASPYLPWWSAARRFHCLSS